MLKKDLAPSFDFFSLDGNEDDYDTDDEEGRVQDEELSFFHRGALRLLLISFEILKSAEAEKVQSCHTFCNHIYLKAQFYSPLA